MINVHHEPSLKHSAVKKGSSQYKAQALILFCSVTERFGVIPLQSDSSRLAPLFLTGIMCDVMAISMWSSGTLQRTGFCPQTRRSCNMQWTTSSRPYFHHSAYFHCNFLFPSPRWAADEMLKQLKTCTGEWREGNSTVTMASDSAGILTGVWRWGNRTNSSKYLQNC